jgi:hypothetical protein
MWWSSVISLISFSVQPVKNKADSASDMPNIIDVVFFIVVVFKTVITLSMW